MARIKRAHGKISTRAYNIEKKPEELGPQVLTMDHLRLGFSACLILASASLAAFIGELMWSRLVIGYRKKMRKSFEEKREIVTEIVLTDQEICENVDENNLIQYDLVEVLPNDAENLVVVE